MRYGAVSNVPKAKEEHFTNKMKLKSVRIKRPTMMDDADQAFRRRSFGGGSPRVGYMGRQRPSQTPPPPRASLPSQY